MEKQIIEAFDRVKMSEECKKRISISLWQHQSSPHRIRYAPIAAAACLLLVVLVFSNPNTVQALQTVIEDIEQAVTSLFFPGSTVTEQHQFEDGNLVVEKGVTTENNKYNAVQYATGSIPSWLKTEADGLYFVCNGERIEIGSLISEEVPFTYVYTDREGITHYILVGGTYVNEEDPLENVGWAEWFQDAAKAETDPAFAWLGGYASAKYDPVQDTNRTWYTRGKDILGVPFP